jgi:hypothetical protein
MLTATAKDLPNHEKTRLQSPFAITRRFVRNAAVGHFPKKQFLAVWKSWNYEMPSSTTASQLIEMKTN